MKKSNFVEGTLISTIGIFICKILGLLYVIPFYKMIGSQGGALYSYAYSIYAIFLSLSTAGIPIAISKIISEYNTLGYNKTKNTAVKIGLLIIGCTGLISFITLFTFSDQIAYLIIGDIQGGNTKEAVSYAIKIVSFALLTVPVLSVLKGYFEGHKIMTVSSVSNVIEQIIRITIIVIGSYLTINIFNKEVSTAVFVSIAAAIVGAISSILYLLYKLKINKKEFISTDIKPEEKLITAKEIAKKIIKYALPFIIIDIARSAYSIIDSFTVVKTMVNLGYSIGDSENTIGVLTTWGSKINMIVVSVSLGLCTSLIPNLTSSVIKKDKEEINNKINQSYKVLFIIILPMAFGLSFLAQPIWNVFYNYDPLCIKIIHLNVIQVIVFCTYTITLNSTQALNLSKLTITTVILCVLAEALLNIPFMYLFDLLGKKAYYGPIVANMFIEGIASIIMLLIIREKYKLNYNSLKQFLFKDIIALLIMLFVLIIISTFIPINVIGKFKSIINILIYSIVGFIIYFIAIKKFNILNDAFGYNLVNSCYSKIKHIFKQKNKQ